MGRIMKKNRATFGHKDSSGYLRYHTGKNQKYQKVHRLVLETFDPVGQIICMYESNHAPVVDHVNGDKHDNRLENLEWVTPQENRLRYLSSIRSAHKNKNYGSFSQISI